ncbi:hypothetical protein [Priestia megaterium]|uniref:hypothetical protein n=1 Tax=Priestia megaterium TaxID=1404 RepID=UPI0015F250D9|nr:hypothetical protein [Priestia megaterium]
MRKYVSFNNEQDVLSEIFKEGRRIVVCALCTAREKDKYHNINISLYRKNQIVILVILNIKVDVQYIIPITQTKREGDK